MSSNEEVSVRDREKFSSENSTESQHNLPQEPLVSSDFFGPALPPHLLKTKTSENEPESKIYGPVLPKNFSKTDTPNTHLETKSNPDKIMSRNIIGPEIPKHLEVLNESSENNTDEEEDTFGPSPSLMATDATSSYQFTEHQNLNKQSTIDPPPKRESWMLELPAKKIGLGARHFRTRIQTDRNSDQSAWTDTPEEKKKKENSAGKKDHTEELKKKYLEERDKEMEILARKAAKKLRKEKSLLEIHRKNIKKKKKKESKKEKETKQATERRPFDRNIDLQIRKIDEGQKRTILNKARFLNDRFASGESKFL